MISNIVSAHQLARKSDPTTSHLAAARVHEFSATHAQRIAFCLSFHGPQTVDQIAAYAGMASQAVNKRLPEMQRMGLAAPVEGEMRLSGSGRLARVWIAA